MTTRFSSRGVFWAVLVMVGAVTWAHAAEGPSSDATGAAPTVIDGAAAPDDGAAAPDPNPDVARPLVTLAVGMVVVLGLIIGLKVNAFVALITAAIVVSFIIAVFRKYHSIDPEDVMELKG